MKNTLFLFIIIGTLFSCGNTSEKSIEGILDQGDLKTIRATKNELATKQRSLQLDIAKLDSMIGVLEGADKLPLVTTLAVQTQAFNHYLELQGDVMTKQNVLIFPEIQGTLLNVYVKEGQRVTKGQHLATIDDGGLASQLQQLKTQAELSKTTFERQKRLWEQHIGSEIQYLQAKASYEGQENTVNQMQAQLAKTQIRAPFSGIIDDVIKDQGTVVSPGPGSEIFRIVNLSEMFIQVDVPETYLADIVVGKEAQIYFPVLQDTVFSKIRQTSNFIKPGNRSFSVEIPVPNANELIKPNLNAKVRLNDYSNTQAILVPQSIISENSEGQQYIYVAEIDGSDTEAEVHKAIVTTGKTQNGYVEILSGIAAGSHIIKEGARSVKEGQKVKIAN
ncbi:efflux RND transporter periplasmic adaptor subunit [Arenibacter sp. GZD96]|uniref:efflux RND transporter periplasmic adaptor subunit n=1 Tax=Aurantibrevibacter litoralis TaxID=3106030 RepID=UPI002AFDE7E7|nr:efflux RND transporter periplasmic adaptor subunit [Arenibacter sp. GZD-96]MEA1786422.1 efflux RND transporter periplasmic adaptor subunit [Arenibacter sp. GZD-96]